MADARLRQRFKHEKILFSYNFLEMFKQFLSICAFTWLLFLLIKGELNFLNSIYSLIILLIISITSLTKSNKLLNYVCGIFLLCAVDIICTYFSFVGFPKYSYLLAAGSSELVFSGHLDLVYNEVHGYIAIVIQLGIMIASAIYTGAISTILPSSIIYALLSNLAYRLIWFKYKITNEKKKLNNQILLEMKESNTQSVLSVVPEGILVLGLNFQVHMKNSAFDSLISDGTYGGLKFIDHHHNQLYKKNSSLLEDLKSFINSDDIKVIFGVLEAIPNMLECTCSKTLWNNKQALVLTFRNVTEIIELERESYQKSEALETIRGLSHDLKTLMNIIINKHLQILTDNFQINPDSKKTLENSLNTCKLLLFSLRDIFDYSNIQNENFRCVISPVNIVQVIEESVEILKHIFGSDLFELDTEFAMKYIETDKSRIQQIIVGAIYSCIG